MMNRAYLSYDMKLVISVMNKHFGSLFIKDKNEYCHDKVTQVYLKINV